MKTRRACRKSKSNKSRRGGGFFTSQTKVHPVHPQNIMKHNDLKSLASDLEDLIRFISLMVELREKPYNPENKTDFEIYKKEALEKLTTIYQSIFYSESIINNLNIPNTPHQTNKTKSMLLLSVLNVVYLYVDDLTYDKLMTKFNLLKYLNTIYIPLQKFQTSISYKQSKQNMKTAIRKGREVSNALSVPLDQANVNNSDMEAELKRLGV